MPEIDRRRLTELAEREQERFVETHPVSRQLFERAQRSLLGGVPMTWMVDWAGRWPVFMERAEGARVADVDGNTYVDLCLGDTGAMTGHAPVGSVGDIVEQLRRGITTMLPSEDSIYVGEELQRRFGLPYWSFTLTATDANRWAIRIARQITKRTKILVFNYCYHGSVDETFAVLDGGRVVPRAGNVGPPVPVEQTTKVVEFNDLEGLDRALEPGDVAAVLAEPALTNIGIVLPDAGLHDALRELTRTTGTLLIIDETHTICAGPGGATKAWGLEPDLFTIGKPIGSGIPSGTFGVSEEVARRMFAEEGADYYDVGGVGGTLAGNALSMAAMRATLENVLTEAAYARMLPLGGRWRDGVRSVIDRRGIPWDVQRLGARAEYWFADRPPRNGSEAAASDDHELADFTHLYALNRGVLLTPFHNMALMSPETTEADVDLHTEVFDEMAGELVGS